MSKGKAIFIDRQGRMRLGWLLCACVILYAAAAFGVYYGYWNLYRTMMGIWGVTGENVRRAPAAVRFLYSWSGVIEQMLEGAAVMAAAWAVHKLDGRTWNKGSAAGYAFGAGVGAAGIGLIWIVMLLSGCARLGWRLTAPEISVNTFALLLTAFVSASAECLFLCSAVCESTEKRLPGWAARAAAAAFCLLMCLAEGITEPVMLINAALTAWTVCLLAKRRGVSAAIGFRFIWEYLSQAVFGFAGAAAALYETYPVNVYWLNGGNSGVMNGVLTTAVLCGLLALLIRKERSKSPS